MKSAITFVLVMITYCGFSQSVREVKYYYDYWKTKIKAVHYMTDRGDYHGTSKFYFEDGKLQATIEYKWGKRNGKTVEYFYNGKVKASGSYVDDKENGESLAYEYDKDKYYLLSKSKYDNGEPLLYVKFKSNGDTLELGRVNGECGYWWDNGKRSMKYTQVNGVPQGAVKYWYDNGQLWKEGEFINGKEGGAWEFYDREGNLTDVKKH